MRVLVCHEKSFWGFRIKRLQIPDKIQRGGYLVYHIRFILEVFFVCLTQSAASAGNYQMICIFKRFYLRRRIIYGSKIEEVFPDDSEKGGVSEYLYRCERTEILA